MTTIARNSLTNLLNSYSVLEPIVGFSHNFSTSCSKKQFLDAPSVSQSLINKHQLSPEAASRLTSFLTHKNLEKFDSVLSFLKDNGFSSNQLEKLVKCCPRVVVASLEKIIKPKIKIFHEFGFSSSDIVEIIARDPRILHCSVDNTIAPSLSALYTLLGSNVEVAKFLKGSCWCLSLNPGKSLLSNVEFLKSFGVPMHRIVKHMHMFPRFLLHTHENMRKIVDKVQEMGVDRSSSMFIYAVEVVSSMNDKTWELKLKEFRGLGFSEDDTMKVFRSSPLALSLSFEKKKKVIEVLLGTGKYDMSCIVTYPTSLAYSVENRYIPRFRILKDLEDRGLIEKWPSLATLVTRTDMTFFEKFVAPYEVFHVSNPKNRLGVKMAKDVPAGQI